MKIRSDAERQQINNFLGRKGLATLDDPRGMVQQLGFLVRDHAHLRSLLTRCEPEHRRDMYESLRPYLRFEPYPLDVYISQAGAIAQAEQLPTVDENGQFHAYRTPEIGAPQLDHEEPTQETIDTVTAQEIVNEAFAKKWLTLTCAKCTTEATYTGDSKTDCWLRARHEGWLYVPGDGGKEHCPRCAERHMPKAA